tara:strand:+ start:662 stop:847 length:186 start_codon:yes stop_codon:yes gene_type:complete
MEKSRIKAISEITKIYTKWKIGRLPDGVTIEMLHSELNRLHDISSGRQYFDYEDQKWIDAV